MEFRSFGFSDAGRHRGRNEDRYLCNDNEGLFLVADGMGGHVSGERASQLAVDAIEDFIIHSREDDAKRPIEMRGDLSLEQNRLLAAVMFANRRILEAGLQNPSMEGMGTTLVGALIEEDRLAVANVGDSRLYSIREGSIVQITEDHSLVGEQRRKGKLSEEEARKHPQRHLLTRALGIDGEPKIDLAIIDVMPKDLFLLCTDGLYSMLSNQEILGIVTGIQDESLYKIGLSLVLQANLAGGMDNITVVLILFQ